MSGSPQPLGRIRSLLFAPAVRRDFVTKLGERHADAVVIDCEDATPPNAKVDGRANALQLAPALIDTGVQVMVRVNAEPTAWFLDDVRGGLARGLAAVVVPKVESLAGLDRVVLALSESGHPDLGVVVGLETALGVADARLLLGHPSVVGGYFGAEDFIADLGGVRTESNDEVTYGRGLVAIAGRLAGVPVLDQVVTDFRNDARFTGEAVSARAMGYAGKLCIHPGQVGLANEAFVPSPDDVDRARRLLAAYGSAAERGLAAIDFEGQMVDEPLAAQARRVLALAEPT